MKGKTVPFMGVSILLMMLAVLAGAFRLMSENAVGPPLLAPLYGLHPLLMILGFVAGIIMTERIAGVELLPSSLPSKLSVAMVSTTLSGIVVESLGYGLGLSLARYAGALMLVAGSGLFLLLLWSHRRKSREKLPLSFMIVSVIALLLSSTLSSGQLPAGNVGFVTLLLLFPIVFILGERVELTSLASQRPTAHLSPMLAVVSLCVLFSAFGSVSPIPGLTFFLDFIPFPLLMAAFAVFWREERSIADRRDQSVAPFQRYVRLHVSAAYPWGLVGAAFGAEYAISPTFQAYDAFVHSLAIGFVGMIFLAHGPVILPVMLGRKFSPQRLSNLPLALLTLGLVLRISGNEAMLALRSNLLGIVVALSGWVVLGAILAFFLEIAHGVEPTAR